MDVGMTGLRLLVMLLRGGFLLFLGIAGWQDYRYRRIRVKVFLGFGIFGVLLQGTGLAVKGQFYKELLMGSCPFLGSCGADLGGAMGIGFFLLVLSAVTGEAVGKGDGWFFVVSGIYLGFWRNLGLLWWSLFLCLMAGGGIAVINLGRREAGKGNMRKIKLPFLTLAVPVGLGVLLL